MIAYIFIVTTFSSSYVKINDLLVYISSSLKCWYKWSNILESSSSYKFWSWVLKKSVVNLWKLLSLLFNRGDLSNFSNLISTCFSYFFFFILCKHIVKWEYLSLEKIKRNNFWNINQVFSNSYSNMRNFIKT